MSTSLLDFIALGLCVCGIVIALPAALSIARARRDDEAADAGDIPTQAMHLAAALLVAGVALAFAWRVALLLGLWA
jgi:hypothetical protein